MKRFKFGLLPRILVAIVLGIVVGNWLPLPLTRVFITFNSIFGQFLGFMIPLIIVGLVTPAIGDIGRGAGRLLVVTVLIAYLDTVFAGLLSFGTGSWLFPDMIGSVTSAQVEKATAIEPYFTISVPPLIDVMSGLLFSFVVGLCIAYAQLPTLKGLFADFKAVIATTISKAIIPLLPIYIFGIFLNMTRSGQAYHILAVFARIIVVIFILHLFILLYEFVAAGIIARRNPFRLLYNMLPAYFTALGTSSSAATIPVTLKADHAQRREREHRRIYRAPLRHHPHVGVYDEDYLVRARHLPHGGHEPRHPHLHQFHPHARHHDGGSARSARWSHHGSPVGAPGVYPGLQRRSSRRSSSPSTSRWTHSAPPATLPATEPSG